jgi:hypothetical protein
MRLAGTILAIASSACTTGVAVVGVGAGFVGLFVSGVAGATLVVGAAVLTGTAVADAYDCCAGGRTYRSTATTAPATTIITPTSSTSSRWSEPLIRVSPREKCSDRASAHPNASSS